MKMDGMKNMGALSQLTNKQKIKGIVFIIALLVLLWQASDLLGIGSGSSSSKVVANKKDVPTAETKLKKKGSARIKQTASVIKFERQAQVRAMDYTQAVNAIELLKLKAQEGALNQKIIEAKLKEVEAQKAIKDLTTVKPKPVISISEYAETLANKRVDLPVTKSQKADATTQTSAVAQTSPVAKNWAVNLKLLFISNQAGKMTAIIGVSGVLYEVQEGSSLPGGWKIQGIKPQKVHVVNVQGKTQTLTLTPVI